MRLIPSFVQRLVGHQPLHRRLRWALWLPAGVAVVAVAAAGQAALAAGLGVVLALLIGVLGEPLVPVLQAMPPPAADPPAADGVLPAGADPASGMLARALETGQTEVHYRPLCALPSMRPCGLEARLVAGVPAHCPPDLAAAWLDAWLLPACQHFLQWLPALDRRGDAALWLPLPDALLAVPTLPEQLEQALATSGLGRERLRLCISPVEAGREARLPEPARQLQQQGYTLVADGFGAGAASLAHLHQLPVRAVRLDRALVARAGQGPAPRLVVESTARLAASLGMSTVADGLDDTEQVRLAAAAGCRLGQGAGLGDWARAEDWPPPQQVPAFADTL